MFGRSKTNTAQVVGALAALLLLLWGDLAWADRLKEIANVRGARSNQLIGYGLVVGLAQTGDDITADIGVQSTIAMLRRLGVYVDQEGLRLRNVAAVIVTAEMPPFTSVGQHIDVTVSSLGNAKSLSGGTLLATPLKGVDLKVYALAQGSVSVGGFAFSGVTGSTVQKNHTTVGRIAGGAVVERGVDVQFNGETLHLDLKQPDFTTAQRVAEAVRERMDALAQERFDKTQAEQAEEKAAAEAEATGEGNDGDAGKEGDSGKAATDAEGEAEKAGDESEEGTQGNKKEAAPLQKEAPARVLAEGAGSVMVAVPVFYAKDVPKLVAELELVEVTPDAPVRVVINERTGTVVLGEGILLSPVAIAHGGLTVEVREIQQASQPNAFAQGETAGLRQSQVQATERGGELREVGGATLADVVRALNGLGVSPRDLVTILQALKSAGALRAELVVQ